PANHLADRLEDRKARGAPPARIRVRKVRAEIAQAHSAQERVPDGVGQDIPVRVGVGAAIVRQRHASKNKRKSAREPVDIVADADAKSAPEALRHEAPPARRCDSIAITSDGSVSFKFEGSPGTTATARPAASTSPASSVAPASVASGRACARASIS